MVTQHGLVFPGMRIQAAIDNADDGAIIEIDPGAFDTIPLVVDADVTLMGSNSGTPAEGGAPRTAETLIPGIVQNGGAVTLDGIRILGGAGDAIHMAPAATGLTLRNSVLIGADVEGSQGVLAHGTVLVEDTRISRFGAAVKQAGGP